MYGLVRADFFKEDARVKCHKCGFEYENKDRCPKCNEPAIVVNAEYYERRKKWEEEKEKKSKSENQGEENGHIAGIIEKYVTPINCIRAGIAVLIIFIVIGAVSFISNTISENKRVHPYGGVWYMDGSKAADDYVYSRDNTFAYENNSVFDSLVNENVREYCSEDGLFYAAVSYDTQKEKYVLYESHNGETYVKYESENGMEILRVNCDGSVYIAQMQYGNFNVITGISLMEIGDKNIIIEESAKDTIGTGKDNVYCYVTDDNTLKLYSDKSSRILAYDVEYDYAVYADDTVYYINNGMLMDLTENIIEKNVDIIYLVHGTGELLYKSGEDVYFRDVHGKVSKINIPYENISDINRVLRYGDNVYIQTDINVYAWSLKSSTVKEEKSNFNIFFRFS